MAKPVQISKKHFDYISDSDSWVAPVCPVIKNGGMHSELMGIIVPWDRTTVALTLMWGLTKEKWENAKKIRYDSIEALLADGWIVD